MKIAIALTILASIAYASGELCECAAFFTSNINENNKVYATPNSCNADCSMPELCQGSCRAEFANLTNNGDLGHTTSQGITVADLACKSYGQDINNGQLAAYSRSCNGDWQYLEGANGKLCCKNGASVSC